MNLLSDERIKEEIENYTVADMTILFGFARAIESAAIEAYKAQQNDAFKNFHRLLCERFDYGHDDTDWKRDQISLIEHIAAIQAQQSVPDACYVSLYNNQHYTFSDPSEKLQHDVYADRCPSHESEDK